jgi:hypothetical protein
MFRFVSKLPVTRQEASKTSQQQHNKALHPTAYSLRFVPLVPAPLLSGFRRRVSLVVVSFHYYQVFEDSITTWIRSIYFL